MPKRPGPPPLPAEVVQLRPGHRGAAEVEARRDSAPAPRPLGPPRPPGDLSPDERECWEQLAPELAHLGLLTAMDWGAFRLACEAFGLARAARREMLRRTKTGRPDRRSRAAEVLVRDRDGADRRSPAFIVWKQACEEYRRWCIEFGLTPSARVGLRPAAAGVGTERDDRADDDDDLFGT